MPLPFSDPFIDQSVHGNTMKKLSTLLIFSCLFAVATGTLAQEHAPAQSTSVEKQTPPLSMEQLTRDPQPIKAGLKSLIEKYGAKSGQVATAYVNLSFAYARRGQEMQALDATEKALDIVEQTVSPKQLASFYQSTLKIMFNSAFLIASEAVATRALPFVEKEYGVSSDVYRELLERIAISVSSQKGREEEALHLLQRARKAFEGDIFQGKTQISQLLSLEAGVYSNLGQLREADEKYLASISEADGRGMFNNNNRDEREVGSLLVRNNYAGFLATNNRLNEAEALLVEIKKLVPGTGMYKPIATRAMQALEYSIKRKRGDLAGSLELLKGMEGTNSWTVSHAQAGPHLQFYPDFYLAQGDYLAGLEHLENTHATFKDHSDFKSLGSGDLDMRTLANNLAVKGIANEVMSRERALNIAFTYQQTFQQSGAGNAVDKMAARVAEESGELGQLAREHERLKGNKSLLQIELQKIASTVSTPQEGALQSLKKQLSTNSEQLADIENKLREKFPKYLDLVQPHPLTIQEVSVLLSQSEAVLHYSLAQNSGHVLVIRRDGADLIPLKGNQKTIESAVRKLREGLDPLSTNVPPFDVPLAHELYQQILEPLLPYIKSVKHLILVPDGALQSLPFGLLVKNPASVSQSVRDDYRSVDWLAKTYAFSTLPSLSALRALRGVAGNPTSSRPFVGFGDPVLSAGSQGQRTASLRAIFAGNTSVANVDLIRQAPSLPETADELRAISKVLKVSADSVFLGEQANETRIKQMDLTPYRILAFSTHGVMAGELSGFYEPGLIMTPPEVGSELDDGYLSASEVAQLKLNADWVLLSACNTAAADGRPEAEGLSGLARAFFYAGARSLLVSHWPVDSMATKELIIGTITEISKNQGLSKSEALRQASLSLAKKKEFSHPIFWAPFVVAGEGGRGSNAKGK